MKISRHSGIELYKVIGILLVITNHIVQTLIDANPYVRITDYLINLNETTNNLQYLICALLRYSGEIGNAMFFTVSAWFFLENKNGNKQKILLMILDIWVISVVIFVTFYIFFWGGVEIPLKMKLRQFFPNILANNWYTTCYILFYLFHPYLNLVIEKIGKAKLLRINICLLSLYFGINFIVHNCFFTTPLIKWVTMYFGVAYVKKYLNRFSNNRKLNLGLLVLGMSGIVFGVFFSNAMKINRLLYWIDNNPFILLIALGLFNLVRNMAFQSAKVNYISKMSLYIYIIHENSIVKSYVRPAMWEWIYCKYGYNYLLIWVFLFIICIFIISFVLSVLYKKTIQRFTIRICEISYPAIKRNIKKLENILLTIE